MSTKVLYCKHEKRGRNACITQHMHHCQELVYYDADACGLLTTDRSSFSFSAGSVSIINRNVIHQETHDQASEVIFIGLQSSVSLEDGVISEMQALKPLFLDIVNEIQMQQLGFERIISLKAEEILIYLERNCNGDQKTAKDLSFCRKYIEENYMHRVSISELAQMTMYSVDHFRHLFQAQYGASPQSYLISVRLKKVKELLRTTELSCSAVAQLCGFSDSSQMTKMFRREYQQTPGEFRKGALENAIGDNKV